MTLRGSLDMGFNYEIPLFKGVCFVIFLENKAAFSSVRGSCAMKRYLATVAVEEL